MAATPHATIGCQELLALDSCSHSGFLRKQMTVKKRGSSFIGAIAKLVHKLPWVQRYVVLSSGSLYHYGSETSKSPTGCYPLHGYNQVIRAGELPHSSHPWAFKIVHERDPNKTKYFAAASESEWKKWQHAIRSELIIASGSLKRRELNPDRSDDDLPVYSPAEDLSGDGEVEEMDSDEEDDKDDYIEIDDPDLHVQAGTHRASRPLPATPNSQGQDSRDKKGTWRRDDSQDAPPMILAMMTVDDDDDNPSPPQTPSRPGGRERPPVPLPPGAQGQGGPRSPFSPAATSKPKSPFSSQESNPVTNMKSRPNKPLPQPPTFAKPRKSVEEESSEVFDEPEPKPKPKPFGPRFGVNVMGMGGGPMPGLKPKPQITNKIKTSDRVVPQPPPTSKKPALKPPINTAPTVEELEGDAYDAVDMVQSPVGRMPSDDFTPARLSWKDYFWDGYDKDTCQQILRNIGEEGVFMVREGNTAEHKTLVCLADGVVRKYKISTTEDGQYSIKSGWNFNSIEALLQHYLHNNLPNRETKLSVPFTKRTN